MSFDNLNFKLLRAMHILLIEQNVSQAAKRLGLSQSALSSQLKQLRAAFGDELLVPSRRGMVPTPRAHALIAPLNRMLGELSSLVSESETFDEDRSQRHFRVAMTEYCQHVAGTRLIAAVRAVAPRIRLSISTAVSRKVYGELQSGDVDLLIGGTRVLSNPLRNVALWSDRLMLGQRKGHPRGPQAATLRELAELDCVSGEFFTDDHRTGIDEALAPLDVRRPIMITVAGYGPMIETIARTDLVAAVPALVGARDDGRIDLTELPVQLAAFTAYGAWHERHHHDAAHRWLRTTVRAMCNAELAVGG
jgi:DNA-binding transcriptional LysR family regulator